MSMVSSAPMNCMKMTRTTGGTEEQLNNCSIAKPGWWTIQHLLYRRSTISEDSTGHCMTIWSPVFSSVWHKPNQISQVSYTRPKPPCSGSPQRSLLSSSAALSAAALSCSSCNSQQGSWPVLPAVHKMSVHYSRCVTACC